MSEVDAMICRVCGKEERASEGYPCDDCGDFICLICSFEGVTRCAACAERAAAAAAATENAAPDVPQPASPPADDDSSGDRAGE